MSKSSLFVGLISLVAFLLLLIFGIASVGPFLRSDRVNGDEIVAQPKPELPSVDFGNPGLGPAEADLTIVVFSDYQCPSCTNFDAVLRQVVDEYPNRIRLVWKDLPNVRQHPEAKNAALAARCAGEQGAFWEYHDLLLDSHDSLTESNYSIFAQLLGLDTESFETCRQERRPEALIDRDVSEAIDLDVTATPYVFIGRDFRQAGAIDAARLKLIVSSQLGLSAND